MIRAHSRASHEHPIAARGRWRPARAHRPIPAGRRRRMSTSERTARITDVPAWYFSPRGLPEDLLHSSEPVHAFERLLRVHLDLAVGVRTGRERPLSSGARDLLRVLLRHRRRARRPPDQDADRPRPRPRLAGRRDHVRRRAGAAGLQVGAHQLRPPRDLHRRPVRLRRGDAAGALQRAVAPRGGRRRRRSPASTPSACRFPPRPACWCSWSWWPITRGPTAHQRERGRGRRAGAVVLHGVAHPLPVVQGPAADQAQDGRAAPCCSPAAGWSS